MTDDVDLLGWRNTRWGMTAAEIQLAAGGKNISRLERQQFKGMYAELAILNARIGSRDFAVYFQMDDSTDTLVQVLLRYDGSSQQDMDDAFDDAIALLSERYGPPSRIATTDGFQWTFPTTIIDAGRIAIDDADAYWASIRFLPTERHVDLSPPAAF